MTHIEEIIASNQRGTRFGGMSGALEVMSSMSTPSYEKCKEHYAKNLLEHQKCVKANRETFGREYRGDYWLDRAAFWREKAIKISKLL